MKIGRIENDAEKKEIEWQLAKLFEELLINELASKNLPLDTPITWLRQNDISKKFVYPGIYRIYTMPEYRSKQEFHHPSYYAEKFNLISINLNTRPYTYTLLPKEKRPDKFRLKSYQESIIKQISILDTSVLIEAPTGAGKSVIASQIAKDEIEKGGIVLVVAPKVILLKQLQETFSELRPQIIHGPGEYDAGCHMFISTLQTAHKRELGFDPTMIIIDEIHYGFSGKMIEQLLEEFDGRLIGLSATPYDQDGVLLKGFGYHINKYGLKYMLENGYLVYPLCYAPVKVDLSPIGLVGGDYNQSELDKAFNNQENILKIVQSTKDVIMQRKASLAFCINIAHAEAMAQAYSDHGAPAKAIHSKLSKSEQDRIMDDYKGGKLKILSNPMMLTTGFDYPATDCIVLARATQSQNLYRQMVGRALRLSEGKQDAIILDCSNVIDTLGLPTKPIEERQPKAKIKPVCKECGGDTFFTRVSEKYNSVYRVCASCGDEQGIEKKGLECKACGLIADEKTRYFTKDGDLYMECSVCRHHTLLEKSSTKEELEALFDVAFVQKLQKEISMLYLRNLLENHDPFFPFTAEVSRHIHALQAFIVKKPQKFIAIKSLHSLSRISDFVQSFKEEGFSGEVWELDKYRGWRLFTQKFEDRLLDANISILKEKIEHSKTLEEIWVFMNQANRHQNLEPLSDAVYANLQKEIKLSNLEGIEAMVLKRIKQLYLQKEPIEKIGGFVQMMEQVLL